MMAKRNRNCQNKVHLPHDLTGNSTQQWMNGAFGMPSSSVVTFDDPWEYQTSIRAADVAIFLTTGGKFSAHLAKIDLGRLWMQRAEISLPVITHATAIKSRNIIYFIPEADQPPVRQNGQQLLPGMIAVYSSGAEHHRHAFGRSRWGSMSLTPETSLPPGGPLLGTNSPLPL
jgi:hypothetical protein